MLLVYYNTGQIRHEIHAFLFLCNIISLSLQTRKGLSGNIDGLKRKADDLTVMLRNHQPFYLTYHLIRLRSTNAVDLAYFIIINHTSSELSQDHRCYPLCTTGSLYRHLRLSRPLLLLRRDQPVSHPS